MSGRFPATRDPSNPVHEPSVGRELKEMVLATGSTLMELPGVGPVSPDALRGTLRARRLGRSPGSGIQASAPASMQFESGRRVWEE